ncbi:MAG: saccharopine dehydrogenase NADP-binding domain-containing protein [Elusimicrobia bacterium]|nr:saccharopine dehydrogenase NADP-binding domain-containing protein [Elusimicrobiota bacterium]
MRLTVLGGFGQMAEAVLVHLGARTEVSQVFCVDLDLSRSKELLSRIPGAKKIRPLRLDFTRIDQALRVLKDSDCVINCAWYEHNLKAMELALALKSHYVDLGGLYHMTLRQLRLDTRFKAIERLAVLGIGSTPGITNLMTARLAGKLEKVESVSIFDASHDPDLSDSRFMPPFSIRTLLEEFQSPVPVYRNGAIRFIPARSEAEEDEFDPPIGRARLVSAIHSELATLPRFLRDKGLKNLCFKIAYPGPVERQLSWLVSLGLAAESPIQVNGAEISPRNLLTSLARKSLQETPWQRPRDFEILRVKASGREGKQAVTASLDCQLRPAGRLSAGTAGVGIPVAVAALALMTGRARARAGVMGPESALDARPFIAELERQGFVLAEHSGRRKS